MQTIFFIHFPYFFTFQNHLPHQIVQNKKKQNNKTIWWIHQSHMNILWPCLQHQSKSTGRAVHESIGLDKRGYQVSIFLISPRKRMLWRYKKNINTFGLKKASYLAICKGHCYQSTFKSFVCVRQTLKSFRLLSVIVSTVPSCPDWTSSTGMLSTPADFTFFKTSLEGIFNFFMKN